MIERILLTAAHAPSAHNRQPWRFCVIKTADVKRALADEMSAEFRLDLINDGIALDEVDTRIEQSRSRITSSPLVIVLCMDSSEMDVYPDARRTSAERMMAIQSTAAAGLQLLPGRASRGPRGSLDLWPIVRPAAILKALELESSWEPQAMFFIGFPDQAPRAKILKPLAELARTF